MKSRTSIAIYDGHNASVGLLVGDEICYAIQEERLTRVKNQGGFPSHALAAAMKFKGLTVAEVDCFILAGQSSWNDAIDRNYVMKKYDAMFRPYGRFRANQFTVSNSIKRLLNKACPPKVNHWLRQKQKARAFSASQEKRIQPLLKLGVRREKIRFEEHHRCHAAASAYGKKENEPAVVITCDSNGDGLCATVNTFNDGCLSRCKEIGYDSSIARIYSLITYIMGMVPMEHEYKLMGMAPYGMATQPARELADFFHSLFEYTEDGMGFQLRAGVLPVYQLGPILMKRLRFERFDYICGGLQLFIEEFATKWVEKITTKLGVSRVFLSGGLFMNVKLNQKILELDSVKTVFIVPSCGDESLILGALYLDYFKEAGDRPAPVKNYYLGDSFSDKEIEEALDQCEFEDCKVDIERKDCIEDEIAKLLAENSIVARFDGRMEFGARALGNRSILANPADRDSVQRINKMIKNRDFWMPFAPAMIHVSEYVDNPKQVRSEHMMLTFTAKPEKLTSLKGATHMFDGTCRVQEVMQETNPEYYKIIRQFGEYTGTSVVLNTSFNLHGFPIVHTPSEALHVLKASGLRHLALGPYLISKSEPNSPE